MGGSSKGGKATVGYHYYMNIHFAIAHSGVDELHEIRVGDRVAWSGKLTGASSALILKPGLFGGEKREGGVLGTADFMPGGLSQPINPYLRNAIKQATGAPEIPAYRDISTVFFKGIDSTDASGTPWYKTDEGGSTLIPGIPSKPTIRQIIESVSDTGGFLANFELKILKGLFRSSFMWGAMNPYFKKPSFLVRRVWKDWYPQKAQIGEDVNPIHILYECLTNKVWGLGYPSQDIDDSSFRAAADVMFDEEYGLSLKWTNQTTIEEFIKMINEHINANLVEDRQTGQWRIIMVRDNYNIDDLFELNESNCVVEDFQRKTMGETVNEVTVAFTRPEDGETDTVTVQNLANFSNTGQVNSQKKEYPGITSSNLAFRVALRDLNTLSKPIAKLTIKCDRSIMGHYPGDVVKVNWPRLGLNGIPLRIGTMNLGSLTKGEIQLEAVEDVFALPKDAYVDRQPIGWVDSEKDAEPSTDQKAFELTYYELYMSTGSADRLDWPEDAGFVAVSALSPNSDANSVVLYDSTVGQAVSQGDFTPMLVLTDGTGYTDNTLHVDFTDFDVTLLLEGGFAYIDDELVEVTGFDYGTNTITVNRGMVDTIPAKHEAGSKVWFYGTNDYVLDNTVRVDGESVDYKLLPVTSINRLPEGLATSFGYTVTGRQARPYRPGNLIVNAVPMGELLDTGETLKLSWSHRDRTQEMLNEPTVFNMGDIGPEPGVQYQFELLDESNVVVEQSTSLITTFEYTTEIEDLNKYIQPPFGIYSQTLNGEIYDPYWEYVQLLVRADKGFVDLSKNSQGDDIRFKDAILTPGTGRFGDGFDFTCAGNSSLSVTNHNGVTLGPSGITIEFWVRLRDQDVGGTVFSTNRYHENYNDYGIGLRMQVRRSPYSKGLVVTFQSLHMVGSNPNFYFQVAGESIRDRWVHIAFDVTSVQGGSEKHIYIDGVPYRHHSIQDFIVPNNFSRFDIGGLRVQSHDHDDYARSFQGYIDSVRVTKHARYRGVQFKPDSQPWGDFGQPNHLRDNGKMTVKLTSIKDGSTSHQGYNHSVYRVGYGYNYGKFYGGVI